MGGSMDVEGGSVDVEGMSVDVGAMVVVAHPAEVWSKP